MSVVQRASEVYQRSEFLGIAFEHLVHIAPGHSVS